MIKSKMKYFKKCITRQEIIPCLKCIKQHLGEWDYFLYRYTSTTMLYGICKHAFLFTGEMPMFSMKFRMPLVEGTITWNTVNLEKNLSIIMGKKFNLSPCPVL